MFAIIGIVIVFGAIVGGYLMEEGELMVLMQPAELVIIGGRRSARCRSGTRRPRSSRSSRG